MEYVLFHGESNDIPSLLQKMDVGLMVSNNEAFGRVTIEYMLQNLCVIANDSGANPEILQNRKTGLIYPKGSIQTLAEQMNYLIMNKQSMIEMARRGKKYAKNNFSSKLNSDTIYNLYSTNLKHLHE